MRRLVLGLVLTIGCGASTGQNPGGDGGRHDGGSGSGDGGGSGSDIDGGGGSGCTGATATAAQPFGNHARAYAAGSILPGHPQAQLDDAVRSFYDYWKSKYLKPGCGAGRYYIATGQTDRMTVSEAHGYGMVVLAFMAGHDPDARATFDGLYHYYKDHPSDLTPSLMAWSQASSCQNNDGANSATDGDLDIAYALLLADKQWSSGGAVDYKHEADTIIGGVHAGDVDATSSYLTLGDWATPSDALYDATRTSDFMPSHLVSFGAATGDASWQQLVDREYGIMEALQTGYAAQTGLLPDFVTGPKSSPKPPPGKLLEETTDGSYSWNACRDPWRIGLGFLIDGDANAKAIAQRMNGWIATAAGGNPDNIRAGYKLNGTALVDYGDRSFTSPFGVAAMVDASNQAWLDSIWDSVAGARDGSYYDDSITMLSLIAMSGNWWAPEAAPCP